MKPSICTRSGKELNFLEPSPDSFEWTDVAYGLAGVHRFAAQLPVRVNVAAHCVFVSRHLEYEGYGPLMSLVGLLHDAEEAFTGDIPAPLKQLISNWHRIQESVQEAVYLKMLQHLMPFRETLETRLIFGVGSNLEDENSLAYGLVLGFAEVKGADIFSRTCERAISRFGMDGWPALEEKDLTVNKDILACLKMNMEEAERAWIERFNLLSQIISPRAKTVSLRS